MSRLLNTRTPEHLNILIYHVCATVDVAVAVAAGQHFAIEREGNGLHVGFRSGKRMHDAGTGDVPQAGGSVAAATRQFRAVRENATPLTIRIPFFSIFSRLPVRGFQSRMVLSLPALARRLPSGEKATGLAALRCVLARPEQGSRARVPYAYAPRFARPR